MHKAIVDPIALKLESFKHLWREAIAISSNCSTSVREAALTLAAGGEDCEIVYSDLI